MHWTQKPENKAKLAAMHRKGRRTLRKKGNGHEPVSRAEHIVRRKTKRQPDQVAVQVATEVAEFDQFVVAVRALNRVTKGGWKHAVRSVLDIMDPNTPQGGGE